MHPPFDSAMRRKLTTLTIAEPSTAHCSPQQSTLYSGSTAGSDSAVCSTTNCDCTTAVCSVSTMYIGFRTQQQHKKVQRIKTIIQSNQNFSSVKKKKTIYLIATDQLTSSLPVILFRSCCRTSLPDRGPFGLAVCEQTSFLSKESADACAVCKIPGI